MAEPGDPRRSLQNFRTILRNWIPEIRVQFRKRVIALFVSSGVITDVRAYASDDTSITILWTYTGTNGVSIYRSADGVTFSEIADVAASTNGYLDGPLTSETLYYYKLTDDGGVTFSTTVIVKTYACNRNHNPGIEALPRFDGTEQQAGQLNQAMESIERRLDKLSFTGIDGPAAHLRCPACVVDGAIVLDCTDGCEAFTVDVIEDINSISIVNCGGICPYIDFSIPANTTVGICGFPSECGYSGDECFESPISGGPTGRIASTNGTAIRDRSGSSTSSECADQPTTFAIKCTQGAASGFMVGTGGIEVCGWNFEDPLTTPITLRVCGGTPPFTWSTEDLTPVCDGSGACGETCCVTANPVSFNPNPGDVTIASLTGCYVNGSGEGVGGILGILTDGTDISISFLLHGGVLVC